MKICTKCKIEKNTDEFYNDKSTKDGKKFSCKKCENSKPKQIIKKTCFTCAYCGVVKEVDIYTNKKRKSNFCVDCHSKVVQKGVKRPQFSRENSPRWNGGEYISSDGYKMIKCEGEFHASGRQKYKKEHILIMEQHVGRELKTIKNGDGESVHHIDGDKLNNNINNLVLCTGSQDHRNLHANLEKIAYELVKNGNIGFNHKDRTYYIRNNDE